MMPRLLLLTDRSQLPLGRSLLTTLTECVRAGAAAIVVRELDLPDDHRDALAAELAALGATVIAAHRPLPHAQGVHLPAGGVPDGTRWGRSCHRRSEVERAAREGAAWVTLSPYAASASKPGHGPPLAPDAYEGHDLPVYALGGIDRRNAADARSAGAHGVAVMGAVMRAVDPAREVSLLLEEVGG